MFSLHPCAFLYGPCNAQKLTLNYKIHFSIYSMYLGYITLLLTSEMLFKVTYWELGKEYKEEGQCAQKWGRMLVFVTCGFI